MLNVDIIFDVAMTSTPNFLTIQLLTWPIQPMYWQHELLLVFSSLEPEVHWWAYRIGRPLTSVVCLSGHHLLSTLFKHLLLRNHWANRSQISYGVFMGWGNKSVQTVLVTWPWWPPCPYMVKIFSGTKRLMTLKLSMQYWVLEYYQVCSNDDPGLTLTYFTAKSNLVPYVWEKGKTMDFSGTIVVHVWN